MIVVDGVEYQEDGDTIEAIKDWDVDDNPWRRSRYYKGATFIAGWIGQETQLPYYKYPDYFRIKPKQ